MMKWDTFFPVYRSTYCWLKWNILDMFWVLHRCLCCFFMLGFPTSSMKSSQHIACLNRTSYQLHGLWTLEVGHWWNKYRSSCLETFRVSGWDNCRDKQKKWAGHIVRLALIPGRLLWVFFFVKWHHVTDRARLPRIGLEQIGTKCCESKVFPLGIGVTHFLLGEDARKMSTIIYWVSLRIYAN